MQNELTRGPTVTQDRLFWFVRSLQPAKADQTLSTKVFAMLLGARFIDRCCLHRPIVCLSRRFKFSSPAMPQVCSNSISLVEYSLRCLLFVYVFTYYFYMFGQRENGGKNRKSRGWDCKKGEKLMLHLVGRKEIEYLCCRFH